MSWRTQPQRLTDALLAVLVVLYAVVERALSTGAGWWELSLLLLASAGPVTVRSRWPVAAALASTGGVALISALGDGPDESFASWFGPVLTCYAVGRSANAFGIAVAVLGGTSLLLAAPTLPSSSAPMDEAVITIVAIVVATAVGLASREIQLETDVLRAQREADVKQAAEQERLRIARELHDVLGHTVSVMGIQAAAVRRRLLPEQQTERDALEAVEAAGREAVGELRRLLGLLRTPDALPEPGAIGSAARLTALVDDVRRSGVTVQVRGAEVVDAVSPAVALTVIRVVQEGLTNVLRHAPGASAEVALATGDGRVRVVVADDGPGPQPGSEGFGLVGMRERVSVFGGTLVAGPGPRGGFVLEAQLPEELS